MAKAGRKRKPGKPAPVLDKAVLPTAAQLANGNYERDFITHTETNTKAMTYRRESSILERWCKEGGPGFGQGAQRVIADCQFFWSRMHGPRVTAQYGERMAAGTNDNDRVTADDATDEIHYRKKLLGGGMDAYWDVFENVVRHNEPGGVAGSSFAKTPAASIQSAKVITGMVASFLAAKLGY